MTAFAKMLALVAGLFQHTPVTPLAAPAVILQVSESGRCAALVESPDARIHPPPAIAPGPPPLLSFRYYEGKAHHRFQNSELMLDDAGH